MSANVLTYEEVDLLLIDPDRSTGRVIRNLLANMGFRRVNVGATLADMEDAFKIAMPDLLICDTNLPDGDFCDFVYKLRHHKVGANPFLPVISTVWSPTQEIISRVVQAGSDDIITKPTSANHLMERIKGLVFKRKPFVVTSAYIGPDRRKKEDRGATDIEPVEVPNVLRSKTIERHRTSHDALNEQIDACIKMVNLQKIDRHASQIQMLVDDVTASLSSGSPNEDTPQQLDRLLYIAEDTARRMVDTPYAHVSELCSSLIKVTSALIDAGDNPNETDVRLLKPLAKSIQKGFDQSNDDTSRMAHEITETVLGYDQ